MTAPAGKDAPERFPEIPGYRIEGILGRGSTGLVYRAVQLAVDREVALKVLHPALSKGRVVRRLQREARTTARLSHPNIVSAIDMGSKNGVWWYAMELVEGPSLAALLRQKGRLSEREALRLFIPLCDALAYLSAHGVVHRDIKPGNILVEPNGRARLVDLGLAFAEDDPAMTGQGGTLGTPHYVSPEQARNPQAADVRSDIWSLGASLFHTVCGRPPFAGESVAEILSFVLYARIPDPGELEPRLSKGLRLVLRKCLSRNPDARYQDPGELLADLERIRERRQVAVRRSALDPVEGDNRRTRWLVAGLALAAASIAVLALTRPWGSGAQDSGRAPVARYEALETLADVEEPRLLARTLTYLEDLEPGVPPEFRARFAEVRATAYRRYGEEVLRLRSELTAELAALETHRDWAAALELVGDGMRERLRLRLDPTPAQLADLEQRLELADHRERLQRELAAALRTLETGLADYYTRVVYPRVDAQLGANHWRSAWETLMVDLSERVQQAAITTDGLPADQLRATLDRSREELIEGRARLLEEQWKMFDRALEVEVERQADELEQALAERRLSGARAALEQGFAKHLESIGLVRGEMLSEVSSLATITLDRRLRKLDQLEAQYASEDARELFEERRDRLQPLWKRRDYARLEEHWSQALGLPYLQPRRERIEIELRAARELSALLDDAVAGLRALAASGRTVAFVVGSIGVEGPLEVGPNPLAEGLVLRLDGAPDATRRLALRDLGDPQVPVVRTDEIERLAGFDPRTATPDERLRRALFRWAEGDLETAARDFPAGPFSDDELDALARDLRSRVTASVAERDQVQQARVAEAEKRFRLINRTIDMAGGGHSGEAELTIQRIDELLAGYGDLDFVREKESYLRNVKGVLAREPQSSPAALLREAFAPTDMELDEVRKEVELSWDFTAMTDPGAWSAGTWDANRGGWQAAGVRSREEFMDPNLWPRLVLRQPLDLRDRLTAELEIEQLQDSGPPQLLVVSVAGVHVAFRGGNPLAQEGRWAIAQGGPEQLAELVSELLDGNEGEEFGGLVRGAVHRIRVELTQGRGKATVYLDGEPLGGVHKVRPAGEPGAAGVVVRSIEAVRLLSARVRASYRLK